ncbi:MAG: MFS transporter [Defluviicoccus sp.]
MRAAVSHSKLTLIVRVLLPFAAGYFLSYLYRVVNAVIAPDLIKVFQLDADQLGLLTGAYFLTFAAAQLPLGIALDRFGARRTEALLLVFAAAGAFVFAAAGSFTGLIVGRALIGFGVSACLMAAFKAFVVWFAKARLPLINGCQMAAGGLGAIAATTPTEAALTVTDWRGVFIGLGALTLLCAGAILAFVPAEAGPVGGRMPTRALIAGVGRIYRSSLFWRVAPATILSQASFLAIQGLWSGRWLAAVEGLPRAEVASTLFLIAAAMIAGFLSLGWAAERLGRLAIPPMALAIAGMSAFVVSQVVITAGWFAGSPWPWIAFGFFGTAGIVPYAALSQRFPAALAGRLNTALNVLVFVVAFASQWGIGVVISRWTEAFGGDPANGYRAAFTLMLALQAATTLWFFVFHREQVPQH